MMGILDRFLNTVKLNDDYEGFGDEDYFDEADDDFEEEKNPKKHILNKRAETEAEAEEEGEEDDSYYDDPPASSESFREEKQTQTFRTSARQKQQRNPKVSPIRSSSTSRRQSGMEVCVIRPHSMEDSREIAETLLENCTVILNMEGLDLDTAQRIIDFSSGSCYALHGNLQKISNYIFIITPPGVDISGDFQEMFTGAVDVPAFGTRF